MWALLSMKLKKETLRWLHCQDKTTSRCVHVLGFVYRKQEEMPARVVVPAVAIENKEPQACAWTNGVCCRKILPKLTSYFNKSTLFFPCGKLFVQLQKCTLFHKLSNMFFPYIPSWEAHKQFRAEPVQYGLEINCKVHLQCSPKIFFPPILNFAPISKTLSHYLQFLTFLWASKLAQN